MPRTAAHQHQWRRSNMIVRQFLHWVRTAPAAERAEATSALARAYLYSDLSPDDRAAAEGAMIMLLDDPSPLVRAALARALAFSENAPPAVILALAADQPDVATLGARTFAAAGRCRPGRRGRDRPAARAGRDRQSRAAAVLGVGRDRRSRLGRSLPGADRESRRPRSRRSRSTASSRASAISRPSARPCWCATICRRRPGRRWSPSLSETLAGFVTVARLARGRTARSASPRRPARRRPSRSPRSRPTARSGR